MSLSENSVFSHLLLLVNRDNQILLEHVANEAPLDAGQWRLPLRSISTASTPPHPKLCGIPTLVAATLNEFLAELNCEFRHIQTLELGEAQNSPAWLQEKLDVLPVCLKLQPTQEIVSVNGMSWQAEDDWLQQWKQGDLLLNPLSKICITQSAQNWGDTNSEQAIAGLKILPTLSNTLPPATHTNTLLLGEDKSWLVDPAPGNAAAMQQLLANLEDQHPDGIFLTHHHFDHHQGSSELARHWKIPLACSADTASRIPARYGKNYFQGCELIIVGDGEPICSWQGETVHAHAVPGHDAGQLALMPTSKRWMLVGDLIQGIGTVVIAKPEGNMRNYFDTLRWVLEQNPAAIIPSHGQVMGSCYRIAETLAHRELRELQILHLHELGHDIDSMVKSIYADVDQRLWPLARMNVECHLDKLSDEGLV